MSVRRGRPPYPHSSLLITYLQDLATVANCESLGEANKIHLSQQIFNNLKNAQFSNGGQMFELGNDGNQRNNDKRFVISERNFEVGSKDHRRVTGVLGQTYFLIRDREKYELEVYNPATEIQRISMERKTRNTQNNIGTPDHNRPRCSSINYEDPGRTPQSRKTGRTTQSRLTRGQNSSTRMTRRTSHFETLHTNVEDRLTYLEDFGHKPSDVGRRNVVREEGPIRLSGRKFTLNRQSGLFNDQPFAFRKRSTSNWELSSHLNN